MTNKQLTREYLEEVFPAELREANRNQGRSPDYLPTRDWFENHSECFSRGCTPRGLSRAIQRHIDESITLNQYLRDQGFSRGHSSSGLPDEHAETTRLVEQFLNALTDRKGRAKSTTATAKSALSKCIRLHVLVTGHGDLLSSTRYDTPHERIDMTERIITVFDRLTEEVNEGTADNYARYLRDFYDFANRHAALDFNPAAEAMEEFDWDPTSPPTQQLTPDQIERMWYATENWSDRKELVMKGFLVIFTGSGVRTAEPEDKLDLNENFKLEDPPSISFGFDRKNGPSDVPIMTGVDFLREYREYLNSIDEWQGDPLPNPDDFSHSISDETMRNWTKALAKEADVRLDDGSLPTPVNIRKFWFNHYHEALEEAKVQTRVVASEQGTSSLRVATDAYITDERNLNLVRQKGIDHFDDVLPDDLVEQTPLIGATEETEPDTEVSTLDDFVDHSSIVGISGLTLVMMTSVTRALKGRLGMELNHLSADQSPSVDSLRLGGVCVMVVILAATVAVLLPAIGSPLAPTRQGAVTTGETAKHLLSIAVGTAVVLAREHRRTHLKRS